MCLALDQFHVVAPGCQLFDQIAQDPTRHAVNKDTNSFQVPSLQQATPVMSKMSLQRAGCNEAEDPFSIQIVFQERTSPRLPSI
jgi:hypothetical protein